MAYFTNPRTEEDLKEQYRKLLIRYDYRNPKNEKLITEIRKEYDEKLMQIKRANGYRTPMEKISSAIKNEVNELKEMTNAENERVNRLRNHQYTKEEYTQSYNNVKLCLRQVVEALVKQDLFTHAIIVKLNILDNVGLYRWFNAQRTSMILDGELKRKYDSSREVLEYAIQSISRQTKVDYEKSLTSMEDTMGQYFRDYYKACCDKYLDPIAVSEYELDSQNSVRSSRKNLKVNGYLMSFIFTALLLTFLLFPLLGRLNGMISTIILFAVSIPCSLPFGKIIHKWLLKLDTRTTFSTLGVGKKQKARQTQKETFYTNRAITSALRALLKLLGF